MSNLRTFDTVLGLYIKLRASQAILLGPRGEGWRGGGNAMPKPLVSPFANFLVCIPLVG